MCGIVGYLGKREAFPILLKGLKRLEYRGYDSAGVALVNDNGNLSVYKTKGKVSDLEACCEDKDVSGRVGIAHTRWATHGEPSSRNAHPHYSSSHNLVIVHNGIIENYAAIKRNLMAKGVRFESDTDTEVLVQLIEYIQVRKGLDLLTSVQVALRQVIGAYAIAVIDKREPRQIIAARKQSPLVVGIGDGEFFLGSDASPIIEYTDKVVYLEDGNIAVMRQGEELKVVNILNVKLSPEVQTVDLDLGQIEKGGFPHFMLKEIFEQPECLTNCMRGRVVSTPNGMDVVLSAITDYRDRLVNAKRFIIVACGTSWHAGLIGKQLIESYCRIPVEVEYASEFRYRNPVVTSDDVIIAISQSGETADTLAAVELAKRNGAFIYGVCNAIASSIARATDTGTYIHVGPEIGVASTKAFTGQVTVLTLLALAIGKEKGTIGEAEYQAIAQGLWNVPARINEVLGLNNKIADLSRTFTYAHNFLYLGRGYSYPVALEGALKLKEISYIHSEAFAAGEMKHGPISLVENGTLVVGILTQPDLFEKSVSNMVEVKSRGAFLMGLTTYGNYSIEDTAGFTVYVPKTDPHFATSLSVIPLQLLAYYVSCAKGLDVDKPRNLAKSVTVE